MSPKRSISSKEGFSDIFDCPDQKHSTKNILILAKDNALGFSRIGVAIRKRDNRFAVDRNNIKRKIKGSFLAKVLELPHKDFIVYVKKNLKGKEEELKKDLDKIWEKFTGNND